MNLALIRQLVQGEDKINVRTFILELNLKMKIRLKMTLSLKALQVNAHFSLILQNLRELLTCILLKH